MTDKLTKEELDNLDMLLGMLRVEPENMPSEPLRGPHKPFFRKGATPLPLEHEAAAENFLVAELEGRCRLSKVTRLAEEQRLAKRGKTRKPYKKTAKGRYHHKSKAKTKRLRRLREWQATPLSKLRRVMKQGVSITQEQWDRLIAPVWGEGAKIHTAGRGTMTVYKMRVSRDGIQVYDGPNQLVRDAQDPRFHKEVMEEMSR